MWKQGFRAEARRTTGLAETDLDSALAGVVPFLNLLLNDTAAGHWNPLARVRADA